MIKINILDTSAAIAIAKDLGMVEVAQAFLAGDFENGIMRFVDGLGAVIQQRGISPVLRTIFMYAATKTVLSAIPGTGKAFNVLGILELKFV
jgi:hypothetical protein